MPHDARGRLIEIGDTIKTKPLNFPEEFVCGRVVKMHSPNSQVCTGEVRFIGAGQLDQDYFNAGDSLLILKADGSQPPCCKRDLDGDGNCDRHPADVAAEEPSAA